MDYQSFVDMVDSNAAIISVEETENGNIGDIRIEKANKRYIDVMGPGYYDGMIYHELIPRELKFEDFCYRAAFGRQRMHTYVRTTELDDTWTDFQLIPIEGGTDKKKYILFIFEFTKSAEPDRMAQSVSFDTAAAVMRCCLKLISADDFQESVQSVINDICELSGADVCRIMLIDENKKEATNYCEAISEKYDVSNYEGDGVIPYETVKSWEDMIGDQNIVVAKNDYEMDDLERRNPAWVREMRSYDVDSIVMLPLQCEKNIVGYLYVVNFNKDNFVATKELLEMMAFILGSEIFNYQTIKRLERMSVEDELTGLLNRNALSIRAGELINDAKMLPFGIVNMDLNGLKEVNDRMGHDAGDEMLRRSAALMKEIFKECEIYRAGGDEFITLMMDTDKESFEKRVEVFHQAEEQESSFDLAIGSFWSETEEDLDKAFVTADMRMYADKKAFYEKHPEKDRRNHV